jgi:hypothetical protein
MYAAKTYKVEYGNYCCFNHQTEQVERLLNNIAPNSFWCNSDGSYMELERDELLAAANKVESMSDEEFAEYRFEEWYTKEYVAKSLRILAEQADPDDSVVHLFWF